VFTGFFETQVFRFFDLGMRLGLQTGFGKNDLLRVSKCEINSTNLDTMRSCPRSQARKIKPEKSSLRSQAQEVKPKKSSLKNRLGSITLAKLEPFGEVFHLQSDIASRNRFGQKVLPEGHQY
jgi:hypothetical protein